MIMRYINTYVQSCVKNWVSLDIVCTHARVCVLILLCYNLLFSCIGIHYLHLCIHKCRRHVLSNQTFYQILRPNVESFKIWFFWAFIVKCVDIVPLVSLWNLPWKLPRVFLSVLRFIHLLNCRLLSYLYK